MGTVKVGCRQVNGIMLRLFREGYDDGTGDGVKPIVQDGPGVRLNGPSSVHAGAGNTEPDAGFGVTEVPREFWDKWVEQNKGKNALFDSDHVFEVEEEAAPPAENPTA